MSWNFIEEKNSQIYIIEKNAGKFIICNKMQMLFVIS